MNSFSVDPNQGSAIPTADQASAPPPPPSILPEVRSKVRSGGAVPQINDALYESGFIRGMREGCEKGRQETLTEVTNDPARLLLAFQQVHGASICEQFAVLLISALASGAFLVSPYAYLLGHVVAMLHLYSIQSIAIAYVVACFGVIVFLDWYHSIPMRGYRFAACAVCVLGIYFIPSTHQDIGTAHGYMEMQWSFHRRLEAGKVDILTPLVLGIEAANVLSQHATHRALSEVWHVECNHPMCSNEFAYEHCAQVMDMTSVCSKRQLNVSDEFCTNPVYHVNACAKCQRIEQRMAVFQDSAPDLHQRLLKTIKVFTDVITSVSKEFLPPDLRVFIPDENRYVTYAQLYPAQGEPGSKSVSDRVALFSAYSTRVFGDVYEQVWRAGKNKAIESLRRTISETLGFGSGVCSIVLGNCLCGLLSIAQVTISSSEFGNIPDLEPQDHSNMTMTHLYVRPGPGVYRAAGPEFVWIQPDVVTFSRKYDLSGMIRRSVALPSPVSIPMVPPPPCECPAPVTHDVGNVTLFVSNATVAPAVVEPPANHTNVTITADVVEVPVNHTNATVVVVSPPVNHTNVTQLVESVGIDIDFLLDNETMGSFDNTDAFDGLPPTPGPAPTYRHTWLLATSYGKIALLIAMSTVTTTAILYYSFRCTYYSARALLYRPYDLAVDRYTAHPGIPGFEGLSPSHGLVKGRGLTERYSADDMVAFSPPAQ